MRTLLANLFGVAVVLGLLLPVPAAAQEAGCMMFQGQLRYGDFYSESQGSYWLEGVPYTVYEIYLIAQIDDMEAGTRVYVPRHAR